MFIFSEITVSIPMMLSLTSRPAFSGGNWLQDLNSFRTKRALEKIVTRPKPIPNDLDVMLDGFLRNVDVIMIPANEYKSAFAKHILSKRQPNDFDKMLDDFLQDYVSTKSQVGDIGTIF